MDAQYKIIGGDGVEYGPATLDELRSWIQEGRVANATQVWREDLASWLPASGYTELNPDLARLMAATARTTTQSLSPAGFWSRLGAWIVDHFLLCIIFSLIWPVIADPLHWTLPVVPTVMDDASVEKFRAAFALWLNKFCLIYYPLSLIYEVVFNGTWGATPGKMAIGAKITMVNGAPIGYGRALLRWMAERVSDFAMGLGYLFIAVRPDKRALHDLLVRTKVVFKR